MTVYTEEGRLIIEGWETTDQDIVQFFDGLNGDAADILTQALKIGVVALRRSQTQVDVDAIRQEFDVLYREFEEEIEELRDFFDPEIRGSATSHIRDTFDEHFAGEHPRFADFLDHTREDSPMRRFYRAIEERIDELEELMREAEMLEAVEEARTEERERSTHKGEEFEFVLEEILEGCCAPFRDEVEHIGRTSDVGTSKKGDLMIHLNGGGSILIEAKRVRMSVEGKTGILEELKIAMQERGAGFGIAVFSEDALPDKVGALVRCYPNNRMICAVPADGSSGLALELAYYAARAELVYQMGHSGVAISAEQVRERINGAMQKLNQFVGLKQSATQLIKTAEEMRHQLDDIEREVRTAMQLVLDDLD